MTLSNGVYDADMAAHKDHLQSIIELGQLLGRLKANADFQEFIKHYIEEDTQRLLVHLATSKNNKEAISEEIHARGIFKHKVENLIPQMADQAQAQLDEILEAESEAYAEGANDVYLGG